MPDEKKAAAATPDKTPPTPLGDVELGKSKIDSDGRFGVEGGEITNRVEGTIQREPTPEELPSDAKVAPLAEQVSPNGAAQAVGALAQPTVIAGAEQPKEGEKNLVSDAADPVQFLPENTEQTEDAERAAEDAERDADRGRV